MSVGERFLRNLFNQMELRYRIEREERRRELEEKYGAPVYFVHELLSCAEKVEMEHRFPEIAAANLYNPRFVVGWIIEEGAKYLLGVKEEQHHWDKPITINGKTIVVAGSIDARDPETGKPIEIKYMSGLYGAPHEHHELQLGMYLWGVGEPVGELWEISPKGIVSIDVTALSDEKVAEIVAQFLDDPQKPRWPEFECDTCSFESFCQYSVSRKRRRREREE